MCIRDRFKNGEDILLGFQTTGAQIWAFLSDRPKIALFDPPVKIRGGVGEMSRYFRVVVHMTEPEFELNRAIRGGVISVSTLTSWPWTCMVDGASCGQSMFQIWTRSVDPRLCYWRLTSDFSFVFRRCSPTTRGDLNIGWTDLHQTWCEHCQVITTHAV